MTYKLLKFHLYRNIIPTINAASESGTNNCIIGAYYGWCIANAVEARRMTVKTKFSD